MTAAAPSAPDSTLIADVVRTRLPFQADLLKITPLAGDASQPAVLSSQSQQQRSLRDFDAIGVAGSLQAVRGSRKRAMTTAELPFINILNHLAKAAVAVPTLYHYDQDAGLLFLQDFGDVTLAEACTNACRLKR